MCGIVGYIGDAKARPILINNLLKLEYRGYDSAGISTIENGKLTCLKHKGRVKELESMKEINSLERNSRNCSHKMGNSWQTF